MIYEFLVEALEELRPLRTFCISGEKLIDNISWAELNNVPTDVEIIEAAERLQAEYDSKQYQRNRAEAYPSTVDQLDDIYHNGVDGWKATIKAVKDTYPKETI